MILEQGLEDREKAEALAKELEALRSQREEFHADWDAAQQFVSTAVLSFTTQEDTADKKYVLPKRITSRPAHFMDTMVSGVCGYSVNQNIPWLKLGFENRDLENQYGVKDWLELVEEQVYKCFNESNLYAQNPQFIESAGTFGHGVMLIDEDIRQGRPRYTAMNPREIFMDTDEYDEVDTIFREFFMSWENAAAYFGFTNLAEQIRRVWDSEKNLPRKRVHLLHAVYRNKSGRGEQVSRNFAYASVFVDLDNKHIIREGGYNDFPYAVFIWKKNAGKKYGMGPAMAAVSDIRILHKFDAARLDVAQFSARPTLNVPQSLQGREEIIPDGRNYYYPGDNPIVPVQVGANFPITLEITQDQEQRIKEWFHVDFFLMLQRMNLNQMTATAVVELQGEKAAVLSNMVSNLNGALHKIIQRTVDILFKQGKLPELPYALKQTNTSMKVDFLGILAQAQRRAHQTGGIMQGIEVMSAMAKIAQAVPQLAEVFDYVNGPEIMKRLFEAVGMSQLAIREDDEVQTIQQARAQAQAAAAEQERAMVREQELLKNYKNLNEPVNPDSPVGQLEQMAGGGT
ncbi:MAG: head-tail connector protein [Treponema sp.]|jgi:hypothetical protein|nr:head-tail connector protein [Treponema sp.]